MVRAVDQTFFVHAYGRWALGPICKVRASDQVETNGNDTNEFSELKRLKAAGSWTQPSKVAAISGKLQ